MMDKVEVTWIDAVDDNDATMKDLMKCRNLAKKYGVQRTSSGWLGREDDTGIVIITDKDTDGNIEITFIPKKMVKHIVRYKR